VGESLAGLFIVETLVLEPTLFRKYIALSPSVWWNNGELARTAERQAGAVAYAGRTLYLASANEAGIADGTAGLAAILKAHPREGFTLYYEPRPDLEHATIFNAVVPGAFVKVLQ
jgi:hypothetical protein